MSISHINMEIYRLEEKITNLINNYSNEKAQCEGDLRRINIEDVGESIRLNSKINCYSEIIEDLKEFL